MNIRFGYVRTMTGKFKSRKTKALKCRLLCRDCDVNLIVMKRKPDYSTLTYLFLIEVKLLHNIALTSI